MDRGSLRDLLKIVKILNQNESYIPEFILA
jgi:hypothetical protein